MPSSELTMTALKMAGALILLLGILILFRRYFGGWGGARMGKGAKWVRVISVCPISLKQQVALVQIPGAILVLGIMPERMTVLSRITDSELMGQILARKTADDTTFMNILTQFRRGDS